MILRRAIAIALMLWGAKPSWAVPGVDFAMRTTRHFQLLIDRNDVSRLDTLAPLAEAAWERLAATTGFAPREAIRVVFHDEDDYSNGWALASNGWVNVWLEPVPFQLRGGVDWTSDVLSHEISHVFTLQALGLDGKLVSASLVGGLDLARFQGSVDAAVAFNDLEAWLAEGLAQIGAQSCGADGWDLQRDALERVAWRTGKTLPDGLLRTYWGDSRESELIYNQGYSFLRWVLSRGRTDLPSLLRSGRELGLRPAIERALGLPFDRALDGWRAWLRDRHGEPSWPAEPGREALDHDAATTWVSEPGGVTDGRGRSWLASSRDNDFGQLGLWELGSGGPRLLTRDLAVRPRISPDGTRLAVVLAAGRPDRRTIQDLWEFTPDSREWTRVTRDGRVLDACATPEGWAVVARSRGRNRVRLLARSGRILSEPPPSDSGDLVQVACGESGEVVATTMGRGGFRLVRLEGGATWVDLHPDSVQRRDPTFARGRLWFSRSQAGRWVAASEHPDSGERIEARSEGGLSSPVPMGDSLLVSRFQAQGFVAVVVPRGGPVDDPDAPPPTGLAAPLSCIPTDLRWGNPAEVPVFSGYGLQLGYTGRGRRNSGFDPGSKWVLGGGAWFANSTMENSAELDVQTLHGGVGEKAGWDQALALSFESKSWSPILSGSMSYTRLTLENRGGDTAIDTLFDEADNLPFLVQMQIQASAIQMLGTRTYLWGLWSWSSLGVGMERITGSMSLDLLHSEQMLAGFGFQDYEQGRFGVLSGAGLQVGFGWVDQTALSTEARAWAATGELRLAWNLRRRLFLGMDAQGSASWGGGSGAGSGSLEASAGIPLFVPVLSIPVTRHRCWTFVDPILRIGNTTWALPASEDLDGWNASSRIAPNRWDTRSFLRPPRPVEPWKAGARSKILQVASVELDWNVLTLSNSLGRWSVGADVPSFDSDFVRRLRWRAGISL